MLLKKSNKYYFCLKSNNSRALHLLLQFSITQVYSVFLHSPSDNVWLSELLRISPEVPGQKCPEGGRFPIKKGPLLENTP